MFFSIPIYLRFALIAACLLGGIALSATYGFWYGFVFILAALLLIVGYLLLGTVQSSAMKMQTADFGGARRQLGLTFFPGLLYKANRAYFYLLHGTIAAQEKDHDRAEVYFLKAQKTGLPTDNEKAMVALQLANIQATKGKWNTAELYFKQLKDLKVTETQLKDQIKQFEMGLKNRGASKIGGQAMMQGGYRAGGKRGRPKMR
ncbi:MAG: hypothetical protein ABIV51_10460 [Saprospiraceae bacterium]